MKTIEFYAWNDPQGQRLLGPVHDTIGVVLRDSQKSRITAFRLTMAEAEKALADLNHAILKAQTRDN